MNDLFYVSTVRQTPNEDHYSQIAVNLRSGKPGAVTVA